MADDVSIIKYVDERFAATNLAISKAEAAANRLHDISNNIANRMLPREEYFQVHRALEQKTDATQRLVWIGVGVCLVLNLAVVVGIALWVHSR